MKISRTLLTLALSLSLFPTLNRADTPRVSFSSPEHISMGDQIILHFSPDDLGQKALPLKLANGLLLTYGEILALPDFYGTDTPISSGTSDINRRQLFLESFNSFSLKTESVEEAKKLIVLIHAEEKTLVEGMQNGEQPEDVYEHIGREYDRQYNCVTGGGCTTDVWWLNAGRYMALASNNYDHFTDNAQITYKIGHQIALEQAVLAHQTHDVRTLEYAYAINAYACHFLSDRFAAGHIRTPRVELSTQTSPTEFGALLAEYMHDEENTTGLHVHNKRGDHWIAYGDKSYFNPKMQMHKIILQTALQLSADAIFTAYQQGSLPTNADELALIPEADETENQGNQDIAPLFYWDAQSQHLMRRVDVSNPYDRHWTDNWWGWTTLIALNNNHSMSMKSRAVLHQPALREQAMQSGLIN